MLDKKHPVLSMSSMDGMTTKVPSSVANKHSVKGRGIHGLGMHLHDALPGGTLTSGLSLPEIQAI